MGREDVRKPPTDAVFKLHPQQQRGTCQWCGKPVTETTATGKLRWWHDDCEWEYTIIVRPDAARRAVLARDKGVCIDCGEDWSEACQLIPEFYVGKWMLERYQGEHPEKITLGPDGKKWVHVHTMDGHPYVSLRQVSLWHVDHKVPLWKAAHMPPLQRLEYFKLGNLITRCQPCHAQKTADEAMDRGKFDRAVELPGMPPAGKRKSKWGGRSWPPKGSRPMRRKK